MRFIVGVWVIRQWQYGAKQWDDPQVKRPGWPCLWISHLNTLNAALTSGKALKNSQQCDGKPRNEEHDSYLENEPNTTVPLYKHRHVLVLSSSWESRWWSVMRGWRTSGAQVKNDMHSAERLQRPAAIFFSWIIFFFFFTIKSLHIKHI